MLNPFDAVLKGALRHFLKRGTDQLQPSAKLKRYLVQLAALYFVAALVIGLAVYRVVYTVYRLSGFEVVSRKGHFHPPGEDPKKPTDPATPPLTPEQQRMQAQEAALAQLATETGFSAALVSQFFKSPEELAKLDVIRDLREQYDLDVAGERYLLQLMATMGERLEMLRISKDTHQFVCDKIARFADRIPGDVQHGGPFADPKLRERRAALSEDKRGTLDILTALFTNREGLAIPTIDTKPISDAITNRKPIRRLDIAKLIVLLRAMNRGIQDLEAAHRSEKEFIDILPADLRISTFTEAATTEDQRQRQGFENGMMRRLGPENLKAARRVQGIQDEVVEQTRRFADDPKLVYGLLKSSTRQAANFQEFVDTRRAGDPELARLWSYSRYGVFAPFALNGLGLRKVIEEHENIARHLEQFLGIPDAPPPVIARRDVSASLNAILGGLPFRAPALSTATTTPEFREAQDRLRVLEEQHWIPTIRTALTNLVGEDQAVIALEGLAGSWILAGEKILPGEGALPITVVDKELTRLLSVQPAWNNPLGVLGQKHVVLEYPGVLPGRWIRIMPPKGVLAGGLNVTALERLERDWPADARGQQQTIQNANMQVIAYGRLPLPRDSFELSTKRSITKRLEELAKNNFQILRHEWQRRWGRPFELEGFAGQWRFDDRGVLVWPDPLIINDKDLIRDVFGPYGIGELAELPGLRGTWEVDRDKLTLKR